MDLCKVVIVGESGSGKTSICNRFVYDSFKTGHLATIGASYTQKKVDGITLQLWDTAGQERFRSIVTVYFRGAHIVFVMFDLSDTKSFNDCDFWLNQCIFTYKIPEKNIILVGCKSDLEHKVTKEMIDEKCLDYDVDYIETSALNDKNIRELFNKACEKHKSNTTFEVEKVEKKGIVNLVVDNTYKLTSYAKMPFTRCTYS